MVGVWEFETVAVRRRCPAFGPLVVTLGVPAALGLVTATGTLDVSFGVLIVALIAIWFLVPSRPWQFIGSAAMVAATFISANPHVGWSEKKAIEIVFMVATAVVLLATTRRSRSLGVDVAVYLGIAGLALPLMQWNHDRLEDVVVSMTVFALAAIYVLGRTQRESRWKVDIYHAEHDALTDALTRHGLHAWLESIGRAAEPPGVIVTCDLDDFKWFNDTFGHGVGDEVLKIFAQRLGREIRHGDALVRLGGDEFEMWLPGLKADVAGHLIERIHRAASGPPFELSVGPVRVGVSMGWCEGQLQAETASRADRQLLIAKRLGKNRVVSGDVADEAPQSQGEEVMTGLQWLGDAIQALWALSPTAAVFTNRQGRIVAANPAFERLCGRTLAELVDQQPSINSAGETALEVYEQMWQTLLTGQPWHGQLKNRRPDGTVWWADEWIVPIKSGTSIVGFWSSVVEQPSPGLKEAPVQLAPPAPGTGWKLDDFTLDVVFQPIVDLDDESVIGYEALIRPRRGALMLAPETFFAEAQESGREVEADLACLQAIRRVVNAQMDWPKAAKLFVNVRNRTLRERPMFPHEILMSLTRVVPFGQIVVEVSERGIETLQDFEALVHHRPYLVFAQDDVGSGEADLARLVRLQPSWVKIDASLVSRIANEPQTQELVSALTNWAHGTGARVIGEAVELLEQARILKDCGVDAGQGYLWARPAAELRTAPRLLAQSAQQTEG